MVLLYSHGYIVAGYISQRFEYVGSVDSGGRVYKVLLYSHGYIVAGYISQRFEYVGSVDSGGRVYKVLLYAHVYIVAGYISQRFEYVGSVDSGGRVYKVLLYAHGYIVAGYISQRFKYVGSVDSGGRVYKVILYEQKRSSTCNMKCSQYTRVLPRLHFFEHARNGRCSISQYWLIHLFLCYSTLIVYRCKCVGLARCHFIVVQSL